jgi:4-amino-4-deoxy-L-arabinose transferase-like glycosyltransferase
MSSPLESSESTDLPVETAAPAAPPTLTLSARVVAWVKARPELTMAIVLTVVFIAIRLAWVTADPPLTLPNRARVYELYTDPPAKSYEARNHALFGQWATSPADNYQFWRIQAPLWVYPISWFYQLFGAGYAQMRTFSTLSAAAGLVLFLLFAQKKLRGLPYFLAGSFLVFNYYYILFARSGLLEALLNTYVILCVFCLYQARRNLAWLLAAEWALVASFLTKQTGLYLLPVCLVAGVLAWNHQRKQGASRALLIAPFVQGAALAGGMAWYVFREAYWRTVTWNYGHMLFNEDSTGEVDASRFPLLPALKRLALPETWGQGFFSLFPIAGALAVIGVLVVLYRAIRKRERDDWELLVTGWLVASFGVLLLTPLTGVHYRLILFPPVAMMAGVAIQWFMTLPGIDVKRALAYGVPTLLFTVELGLHGFWYWQWASTRSYDMTAATDLLRSTVGNEGNVFAGMWSGPLIFNTKNKYYYIKAIFNSEGDAIAELHLTHLLELDKWDLAAARIHTTQPEMFFAKEQRLSFDLRGHTLKLYEFTKKPAKKRR